MATTTPVRRPFAALDDSRLRELTSIKNRQNAITASLTTPGKQPHPDPSKPGSSLRKRYLPTYDDDPSIDSENLDPLLLSSPSKRSKGIDGTPGKASKFVLTDAFATSSKPVTFTATPASSPTGKRTENLSLSVPTGTKATPISASRGSPKHKRISLLSKRRASSSPYRRVDPPPSSFSRSALRHAAGTNAPFSIDAALSGTISNYTPKTEAKPATLDEPPMPKNWFFDIYVDSPDEEAANLMEHSAAVLDISSDDDADTKRANEALARGKENIPPEWPQAGAATGNGSGNAAGAGPADAVPEPVKKTSRARMARCLDDMVDDVVREPLMDLPAREYYADGLDEKSVVTVDGHEKDAASVDESQAQPETAAADVENGVAVWVDDAAGAGLAA